MFERFGIEQDVPIFNKEVGRTVTDRLNMGRLYVFNIFGCVVMLLVGMLLSLFKWYVLPEGYQAFGLIMFAVMAIFNKISFKHLAYIMIGLSLLSLMFPFILISPAKSTFPIEESIS